MKGDTFETEGTVYTEAGKVWGDFVKPWIVLFGGMHGRVVGDNSVQIWSYYAKAQLADYNVHIWFFGAIGCGEISKDVWTGEQLKQLCIREF